MTFDWDRIRRIAVGTFCAAAAAGSLHVYWQGAALEGVTVLYGKEEPAAAVETLRATAEAPEATVQMEETERRIDLNSATEEQLCTLKGIGPAKAGAILDYRENYGGFVCVEEIMEVKGIGPGTFEKIRDFIYVAD